MKRRVVITGMGILTTIGQNVQEFWSNCMDGKSRVERIPDQWFNYADFHSHLWSPFPDIDYSHYNVNRIEQKQLDKTSLIAIGCAFQALDSANLEVVKHDERRNTFHVPAIISERAGVFIGTGIGGIDTLGDLFAYRALSRQKEALSELLLRIEENDKRSSEQLKQILKNIILPKRFNPFAVSMVMPNACSANLGVKLDIHGSNNTFCAACASGTVALGYAFKSVRSGELDLALSGGVEYINDEYGSTFYSFDVIRALTNNNQNPDNANCPFDTNHSGFLLSGGGGAILVLEELEHAIRRGAPIIAEIIGYAETCDAHHIMMIEGDGYSISGMIKRALADGGISETEVDYINAHGTGALLEDEIEAQVIEELFGKDVLINSTKSLLGNTLGASGAIEAVVVALGIKHQTTHICKNLHHPIRDLNFVRNMQASPIKTAISQSFGFGGHNAALLFREYR